MIIKIDIIERLGIFAINEIFTDLMTRLKYFNCMGFFMMVHAGGRNVFPLSGTGAFFRGSIHLPLSTHGSTSPGNPGVMDDKRTGAFHLANGTGRLFL